jgi:phenylpropionate dioxygenase-like ring-hydroxylating dioxygenase large terminal subunit
MLNNFWYACEFSHAVSHHPQRITLFDQNIVLYRTRSGQVVAFRDRCPHRGAALSGGKVAGDCLHCPYHGWKFQADGDCIEIPANPPGTSVSKQAHLIAYPTQEKYGFVWLFWGDCSSDNRPPLPSFPAFPGSPWRAVSTEMKFQAFYIDMLENQIDPIHVAFIHNQSFGSGLIQDLPRLAQYDVQLEEWGGSACIVSGQPTRKRGLYWRHVHRKSQLRGQVKCSFHLPNALFQTIDFKFGLIHYSAIVPVNETTTILKQIQFRNFLTHAWADGLARRVNLKAFQEDQQVVESISYPSSPDELNVQLHGAGDTLVIAYRKLYQKYLKRNWSIDPLGEGDFVP